MKSIGAGRATNDKHGEQGGGGESTNVWRDAVFPLPKVSQKGFEMLIEERGGEGDGMVTEKGGPGGKGTRVCKRMRRSKP